MPDQSNPSEGERGAWRGLFRAPRIEVVVPGPGQESVWDYPRPPKVEEVRKPVRIEFAGIVLVETRHALRICETASPPTFYLPQADIAMEHLERSTRTSFCEWKGASSYWSVRVGDRIAKDCAWSYAQPSPGFVAIRDHIAFYPRPMDACFVGDDRVTPQPGSFYGGWVTPDLTGPFKGMPGSEGW